MRQQVERRQLNAADDERRTEQHGVDAEPGGNQKRRGHGGQARRQQRVAWMEKQPAGGEHEQQAQMAPAVAPGAQMRRTVGVEGAALHDRRLGDAHVLAHCLDDHLARRFVSRTLQREGADACGFESPQAAMEVAHRRAEEQPAEARQ